MELKQLNYFLEVCKQKSFSKAATKLYITQQGISKAISTLENELNTTLFIRLKSGVELTSEGEYLKKQAEKIFGHIDEIHRTINNDNYLDETKISLISGARSIFPINITEKFNKKLENKKIMMKERSDSQCIDDIFNNISSAAITVYPEEKENLRIFPLTKEKLCVVINKNNPLAKKDKLYFQDFNNVNLILISSQEQSNDKLTRFLKEKKVNINIFYEVPSLVSALELCRENLGIVITLEKIMQNLVYPDVVTVPIQESSIVWELYYIFKKDEPLKKEIMNFYEYLLDYLNNRK